MRGFRIAAAAIVVAIARAAHADPVLSIDAPASASIGATVIVNADITSVTDLYDFEFDLSFDPTVLSATSSNEGPFLSSGGPTFFIPGVIDNVNGAVAMTADTLLAPQPGVSGSGTLVSFSFSAIGLGSSPLTLSNVILQDSNSNDIPFTLENGSVTIESGGPPSVPEPGSLGLLALGLMSVFSHWRRRN